MTERALYAGADFQTHLDELTARVQAKFAASFNDFAISQLGIVLLDLVAYASANLSFYLDRRAAEGYLATCRTRRAMSRLTRQLGYKMGAATAASVDLRVSLTQTYAFNVTIPKGFQFQGPDQSIFEVARDVTILAGDTGPATVPCYQGRTLTETFTGDGLPNQVFQLRKLDDAEFVVQGYNLVSVDALPYQELEFLDVVTTSHYEVGYNDDPPTLRFGDGVAGVIPPSGATIEITYVASKGKAGQAAKDTDTALFAVVSPLVVAFQTIPLTISNPDGSVGGDDPETLEHARAFAPKVWRSLKVAVTQQDYDALAGSYADALFGRVAVAKAVSAHDADSDVELKLLLNLIRAEILPVEAAVLRGLDGEVGYTGLVANLASANAALSAASVEVSDTATENDALMVNIQGAQNTVRDVKNLGIEISSDASQITTKTSTTIATVTAIPTGVSSTLLAGDKTSLLDALNVIAFLAGQVSAGGATVQAGGNTALGQLGEAADRVETVGTSPVNSSLTSVRYLDRIQGQLDAAATALGPTGAEINVTDIRAAIVGVGDNVDSLCTQVFGHVDALLASDCQANLVSVPILSRDSAGFYVAPSVGLIQSLQSYLDARKEVTQVVRVVSGADLLVQASVRARIGVRPGRSLTVTTATAEAAINAVLRDRAFGASLYQSALWDAVTSMAGVVFANVEILGHLVGNVLNTDKLDSDGNLLISSTEVVTRGAVTLAIEVVPES